jgi:hypothetical protein
MLADAFTEEVHKELDEYENDAFWSIMAEEMGERDMRRAYREAEMEAMSDPEYQEALDEFTSFYGDEFNVHGVEHMSIDHPLTVTEN